MIQAMITCPTTGRTVPTSIVFGTLAAFEGTRLENNHVKCRACGQEHRRQFDGKNIPGGDYLDQAADRTATRSVC